MFNVGPAELLMVVMMVVIALINLAIPIATLVMVFLMYGKVKHIERALNRRE